MNYRSPLGLVVEAGPRQGETIEWQPGSEIRIGRISRANTFVIKDAGISSNHLIIKFDSGKWIIQDLDSSNGTFVNGVQIRPLHNFNLNDGDVIKLGEITSIAVHVDISGGDAVLPQLRRSTRRREPVLVEQVEAAPSTRRNRGGRAGVKAVKQKNMESEPKNHPVADSLRRGRRRKGAASGVNDEIAIDVQNVEEIETFGKRRSTRRKNQRLKTPAEIPEVVVEEEIDLGGVEISSGENTGVSQDMACPSLLEFKHAIGADGAIDLEKMTLGEWFEFLRVQIPKEIHEETEKIIEAMKLKAEKCETYVADYRKMKEKLAV